MSQEHYTEIWEKTFKERSWGKYPPEDLVRFIGRRFKHLEDKTQCRMLEMGSGPGANLWFLHREGYHVSGIDISDTAIALSKARIVQENEGLNPTDPDIRNGNFESLPWEDERFNVVVDIFSLCANPYHVIENTLSEVRRVLKKGGFFYSKMYGTGSDGYGLGEKVEDGSGNSFQNIPVGPFKNMGLGHFTDEAELAKLAGTRFEIVCIDRLTRTDAMASQNVEEYACQMRAI